MTLSKMTSSGMAAAIALGMAFAVPAYAQSASSNDSDLAADTLTDGETDRAILMLEAELENHPNDPALLINLGIAQAQAGKADQARDNFEAALRSRESVELATADGREIDSKRLARQALGMLDRGEFRPDLRQGNQLTLRD